MHIEPFHVEHLDTFVVQDAQVYEAHGLNDVLRGVRRANTILHEGHTLCIFGTHTVWPGRAIGWSYMDAHCGPFMFSMRALMMKWMEDSEYQRIEASTRRGWPEGFRWLELLGYNLEGIMRKYYPDGGDACLFAWVRP